MKSTLRCLEASLRATRWGGSSTMRLERKSDRMPTGRLMKKIQCQLKLSVIQPPRVGPMAGGEDHGHAVDGEGLAALFDGEGVGEDGLLTGSEAAAAEALQNTGKDEERQGGRDAAEQRAESEHGPRRSCRSACGRSGGEPAGDGENDGAGDEITGEDPGGFVLAGAERAGHVGQGDVGDGGVEHLHERGQCDRHGDSQGLCLGLHEGSDCAAEAIYQSPDIVSGD